MIPLARLFSATLCSLLLTGTAHADEQAELENLRKRIAAVQRDIDKTSESKSEVADDLRVSERAISDANRQLAELAAKRQSADRKLRDLEIRERAYRNNIAEQKTQLGKLLYHQYLDGNQEHLKLLLNGRDPNQSARNLQYYQYIAHSRADWLAVLRNDLAKLKEISSNVREQRAELVSLQTRQSAQKALLKKEQHARQLMLAKISRQLRQQRNEIKNLKRNENRLAELVEKISEMLAQRKSGTLFRNDNLPDARFDGNPFSQLKGKLILPVKGVVTNRFNTLRPGGAVLWKGLFMRTSSGQAVKAIAAGRVVFADWLRGFGNLLIIDHGNSYMSLYGNNETLYKQVGDVLRGGDTIAAAGNSGGNEDFGLYFELRHQSKPLDPMKWLAKK